MNSACSIASSAPCAIDAAAERAAVNWTANLAALSATQPALASAPQPVPDGLSWIFARDGSLTALLDGARWWAGCSVPLAAARFMLKSMEIVGITGCFLSPRHAAQLRVALDRLNPRQAIVAIVPENYTLAVLLHTDDFSEEIDAGRLWFASGTEWETQLQAIFADHPGLVVPTEFIRAITADCEPTNALIEPAQYVFRQVSQSRSAESKRLREQWVPGHLTAPKICLLAPSQFTLWVDAALVLADMDIARAGMEVYRLDSDRPTTSAPLALAMAASGCHVVFCANIFRSQLPGVIAEEMPWITWVTTQRISAAKDAGPNDRLLLADVSWLAKARELGWPETRIDFAGRPALPLSGKPNRWLALIADTHPLDIPKQIEAYSSQALLWETIRDELMDGPFLAVDHIEEYLDSRRARLQIGDDGFSAAIFTERLIVPAVQQGVARRLIKDGMPLRLFGLGWEKIDGLAQFHAGPISCREQLVQVVSQSAALVHVWPWNPGHTIETTGRPVIRTNRMHDFLGDVRQAINGTLKVPVRQEPAISPELIARVIRQTAEN